MAPRQSARYEEKVPAMRAFRPLLMIEQTARGRMRRVSVRERPRIHIAAGGSIAAVNGVNGFVNRIVRRGIQISAQDARDRTRDGGIWSIRRRMIGIVRIAGDVRLNLAQHGRLSHPLRLRMIFQMGCRYPQRLSVGGDDNLEGLARHVFAGLFRSGLRKLVPEDLENRQAAQDHVSKLTALPAIRIQPIDGRAEACFVIVKQAGKGFNLIVIAARQCVIEAADFLKADDVEIGHLANYTGDTREIDAIIQPSSALNIPA